MRLLSLLKRYWLYSLTWLVGLWLLWLVTPIRPILASTVYEDEFVVGFLHSGREFVTLGYSKRTPNQTVEVYHGPILIKDTETGEVKRSLFASEDRFVSLYVEMYQDHVLRVVRKQGKNANGKFKYLLEWIDSDTGETIASFCRELADDYPENRSVWFPAALSPDRRYAVYLTLMGNKRQTVCVELSTGKQLFGKTDCGGMILFSPDGRYLKCSRNGGIVVLEMPSGQEILEIPSPVQGSWLSSWWAPNSKLLYISNGTIWNVEKKKCQIQFPEKSGAWLQSDRTGKSRSFTSDSREIISTEADDEGIWLVYYDVNTGEENESKRLLIMPGIAKDSQIFAYRMSGPLIMVHAGANLDWNQKSWSGKIHGTLHYLQGLFSGRPTDWNRFSGFVVIDEESNKIIMRGEGTTFSDRLSPDGKYLFVTVTTNNNPPGSWSCECWNVPPQKAIGAFLYGSAAWLLGCLLLRTVLHLLSLRPKKSTVGRLVPGL